LVARGDEVLVMVEKDMSTMQLTDFVNDCLYENVGRFDDNPPNNEVAKKFLKGKNVIIADLVGGILRRDQ